MPSILLFMLLGWNMLMRFMIALKNMLEAIRSSFLS